MIHEKVNSIKYKKTPLLERSFLYNKTMIIAGIQKTTLIDYPGKIACVVFLAGCNFRCPWCYSSELVLPLKILKQPRISEKEIFDFLEKERGCLEGVVLCGGEPTVNKELPTIYRKNKKFRIFSKIGYKRIKSKNAKRFG